ncbi:hypothetical protein K469DRAFT_167222 [Zopfia rhizophila CBS 207.26]|uniref:DUF676 domain-containing protein n=1 Tax=Zopfia rhizophila CBS 207.26 TaxID=1314779 RepID=A0A6A6DZ25_9PEZI|nr:hypothetical protein K469DRAFT_167222 [Zopfia rhizophila CBS 207.26]
MCDKKWWKWPFRSGGKDSVRTQEGSPKYGAVSSSANPTQANVVLRSERATPPTAPAIQRPIDASASLPVAVPPTKFDAGLHVIFDSVDDDQSRRAAEMDVVAVHGLNFKGSADHARETWTKGDKLWLKDFLPVRLPKLARVMLFAYNSSPAIDATAIKLDDHAKGLLQWLSLKRKDAPQRPLVFICHSLGGLVVKQALVEATLDVSYKSIVDATHLLVFFATPHQGGNHANLGEIVAKIVKVALQKPPNDLLDALKRDSNEAIRRFEQARHVFDGCLVVNFFEGESYGKLGIIVDKKSATLNLPGSREKQVPTHANHSTICKFDSGNRACELVLDTIAAEVERALGISQNS